MEDSLPRKQEVTAVAILVSLEEWSLEMFNILTPVLSDFKIFSIYGAKRKIIFNFFSNFH